MPASSATIPITSNISIRVTPCRVRRSPDFREITGPLLRSPADDVGVDRIAAGLAVGAKRDHIRLVAVFARILVDIRAAPRIERNFLWKVWAGPQVHALRLHAKR